MFLHQVENSKSKERSNPCFSYTQEQLMRSHFLTIDYDRQCENIKKKGTFAKSETIINGEILNKIAHKGSRYFSPTSLCANKM